MSGSGAIVGIDLGTTNSEIAAFVGDRPKVLGPSREKMLPSCVGISPEGEMLIGEAARNQMLVYPERTVSSVKRKMGSDEKCSLGEKTFSPSEISALILRELIQRAQRELNEPVGRAVITVPAYFSDSQRQATREAGALAGVEVIRVLNEPTAASLAYGCDESTRQTVIVYDLGGGTFDVSIVSIEGDVTEVLASHGNNRLGGDDFDQLLLDRFLGEFEKRHGIDLRDRHPASYSRLRWAAEEAKKKLSAEAYVRVREEALATDRGKPLHLDMEIARSEYEEMIRPLAETTLDSVFNAMEDASRRPDEIDVILLVGGSTRTPLIRKMLEERVEVPVREDVHPDLCVALGAGLLASRLDGHDIERVLVDVSPYSFGPSYLGILEGREYVHCYRPIIKRNTSLPVTRTEQYCTPFPQQESVQVEVFQGENPDALKNILVGNFMVEGLTPMEEPNEVLCRMSLDVDGILKVEAIEKRTGLTKHITIRDAIKPKSEEELARARARLERLHTRRPDDGSPGGEVSEVSVEIVEDGVENVEDAAKPAVPDPEWVARSDEAEALMERSRGLLRKVHDEDKEEMIDLHETIRSAVERQDLASLSPAVDALNELLFFVEGR
jgi:molecular chaperone DnaK